MLYRTAKVQAKIQWDYGQLWAKVGHHQRDKYYNQLGGISGSPHRNNLQDLSAYLLQTYKRVSNNLAFARPNRVPISELQAMEQSSVFQRPERVPISQLTSRWAAIVWASWANTYIATSSEWASACVWATVESSNYNLPDLSAYRLSNYRAILN